MNEVIQGLSIGVLIISITTQHLRLERTEAEYGVLKTRIEQLEKELHPNGR